MLFRAKPLPICKLLSARFAQNIPRKSLARRRAFITYSGSSVICRWFFSALFRANLLPICKLLAAASPQGKGRGTSHECKVLASKPAAPFPHKSCSLEPAEKCFGRHPALRRFAGTPMQNIPRKSLARRRVFITYSGSSVILSLVLFGPLLRKSLADM